MNIFNYDNPIMQFLMKLARSFLAGALWFICCIPLFTVGASTSALYYTVEKVLKNDLSYVAPSFFGAFKSCFKKSTLLFLPVLAVELVFAADISVMRWLADNGKPVGNIYPLFYVLMILVALYAMWAMFLTARFENTLKNTAKNALFLMIRHLGTTVVMGLITAFSVLVVWLMPPTLLLMPVISVWLSCYFVERVFQRYSGDEKIHEL